MKPVIKIWCLPHDQTEDDYKKLHQAVVAAVVKANVGIKNQNDMVVLMPKDLMDYGLGEEIIVEIDCVGEDQCGMLSPVLDAVKSLYPKAHVQGKTNYIVHSDAWPMRVMAFWESC